MVLGTDSLLAIMLTLAPEQFRAENPGGIPPPGMYLFSFFFAEVKIIGGGGMEVKYWGDFPQYLTSIPSPIILTLAKKRSSKNFFGGNE